MCWIEDCYWFVLKIMACSFKRVSSMITSKLLPVTIIVGLAAMLYFVFDIESPNHNPIVNAGSLNEMEYETEANENHETLIESQTDKDAVIAANQRGFIALDSGNKEEAVDHFSNCIAIGERVLESSSGDDFLFIQQAIKQAARKVYEISLAHDISPDDKLQLAKDYFTVVKRNTNVAQEKQSAEEWIPETTEQIINGRLSEYAASLRDYSYHLIQNGNYLSAELMLAQLEEVIGSPYYVALQRGEIIQQQVRKELISKEEGCNRLIELIDTYMDREIPMLVQYHAVINLIPEVHDPALSVEYFDRMILDNTDFNLMQNELILDSYKKIERNLIETGSASMSISEFRTKYQQTYTQLRNEHINSSRMN